MGLFIRRSQTFVDPGHEDAIADGEQGGADEQVDRVLPGQLAHHAVGAHRAVAAGEEHVRTRGDVVFHAQFGAEAMHAFDPAALDRRDQRRVRVERPVAADLAFQAQRLAVGRQDQLDGGGVEADAMVERLHLVSLVNTANRHHRHQHMHRLDMARVAGEQRLDIERLVGDHDEIHPARRNVHAWQLVDDLVDLEDHDAITEGRGLDQRRGVRVWFGRFLVGEDGVELLRDFLDSNSGVERVGFGSYPDGHAFISREDLSTALHHKQKLLEEAGVQGLASTQMCFDIALIRSWLEQERNNGFKMPIQLGVPGVVDRTRLMTLGVRVGVGQSMRYLSKNKTSIIKMLSPGGYDPTELVAGLAKDAQRLNIVGLHSFTFNSVADTAVWQREVMAI